MTKFNHVTGQLFFRLSGQNSIIKGDPRELFAVVGILAIPQHLGIQNAHIYTITGSEPEIKTLYQMVDPDFDDGTPKDIYNMQLHRVTGWDYTKESMGSGIGHLLTHGIWRV